MVLLGFLGLSCAMVWGQAPPPTQNAPTPTPPAADAPKPSVAGGGTAQPVDPKTYIIGVQDELKIEVFRETELTRNVIVRTDGKITMPLLNDVQAEGLTPERLQKQLTDGLTGPIAAPVVTVTIVAVNSKKYNIGGLVNHPGTYFLVTPIRIFDALNAAGGFQPFANQKDILIVRGDTRLHFNYNDYLKGKNGKNVDNFFVETGDTIYVQ
jgi:polysaccharide export outer membrane protein